MLNDFTWNMTGYIPKYQVNPHGDGIIPYVAERIFQLEPEPPAVDSLNEYILSALQEKNLIYFSFFLHHYEPQLNKRIKDFLGVDGGDLYDTDRFIDIKLSCREQMLQKLMDYDLAKGAEYATYIFPFIRDAMLRFRMGEEKWSVSSLTNYKMVRSLQNGAVNSLAVPQYQGCGQRIFQEIQLRSCPCGRISESCPWNPQSAAILRDRRGRRRNR